MWAQEMTNGSCNFTASQGDMKNVINTKLHPACHSGDMQAVNARSSHVHIILEYKIFDRLKGKWLVKT